MNDKFKEAVGLGILCAICVGMILSPIPYHVIFKMDSDPSEWEFTGYNPETGTWELGPTPIIFRIGIVLVMWLFPVLLTLVVTPFLMVAAPNLTDKVVDFTIKR